MTKTENTQPQSRPFASGDHCSLRTIKGQPCAVHRDCDDYPDGTITSIITGEIIGGGN